MPPNGALSKLRRHPFRAAVGALAPTGIAVFYLVIYFKWLRAATSFGDIETGPRHASLIFYTWFIVGVFGLSLGEYGLAGSEAGMLMTRLGRTPHGGHVLLHADKTWTGLSGWGRAARTFWAWRSGPSLAWTVLAAVTVISCMALPLSGLTFELRRGYVAGSRPAIVFGANASTFNSTHQDNALYHAVSAWRNGRSERPPGMAVLYTAEPRGAPLRDLTADGVPDIFVAPQSDDSIVSGRAWGVAARYNCSVVDRLENFALYNHFNSTVEYGLPGFRILGDRYRPWEGATFILGEWNVLSNVAVKLDLATSLDYTSTLRNFRSYKPQWVTGLNESGAFSFQREYPGLDEPIVVEAVLWQVMRNKTSSDVGTTVAGLLDTSGEANFTQPGDPVAAIGVTCSCASAVGEATLNGLDQTYSDFVRESLGNVDDKANEVRDVPMILPLGALKVPQQASSRDDPIHGLFASVLADNMVNTFDGETAGEAIFPQLLTSDQLRRSILGAFAAYLTQLMYRGSQVLSQGSQGDLTWTHDSLFVADETVILAYGLVPPALVAALLIAWASACLSLSICYGFRRRWSETLDSYSAIRFGADAVTNGAFDGTDNPREMEDCQWVKKLPGMVGDGLLHHNVGYITLSSVSLDKKKHYL